MTSIDGRESPWRLAAPLVALVLVTITVAYWETLVLTERHWRDHGAYGHGYLVVAVTLYALWTMRNELRNQRPQPNWAALPFVLAASATWLVANEADVQVGKQLAIVAVVAASVWALLGTQIVRSLCFPLTYVLVAIPVWTLIIPTLQDGTALAAARSLRLLGIPVFLEGHFLSIPEGNFEIARVCAGLRYLLATMALAAFYAHLNFRRFDTSIVFMVLACTISIIFNWLRVDTIIVAGHLTRMEHALVQSHIEFGWVVFVIGLVPIFVLGRYLEQWEVRGAPIEDRKTVPDATAAAKRPFRLRQAVSLTLIVALIAASGPVVSSLSPEAQGTKLPSMEFDTLRTLNGWTIRQMDEAQSPTGSRFVNADSRHHWRFSKDNVDIFVYGVRYASQSQGKELVFFKNRRFDQKRWKELSRQSPSETQASARRFKRSSLESLDHRYTQTAHVYVIAGRTSTSLLAVKLWQVWSQLMRRPGSAAAILVVRELDESNSAIEFDEFLNQNATELLRQFGVCDP